MFSAPWLHDFHQPVWPDVFGATTAFLTKNAEFCHGGSGREEKAKDQEGCGNPNSEARRLLQESEESRHAFTDQRHQEVAAQIAPSHLRGGYTATHTHSNNPEDVS